MKTFCQLVTRPMQSLYYYPCPFGGREFVT